VIPRAPVGSPADAAQWQPEATSNDQKNRNRGLSIIARRQAHARHPQCGHRRQRQRQVQPVSRPQIAGGHRPGPHHSIFGCRRRPSFHALGRSRIVLARDEEGRTAGPGNGSKSLHQPEARLCRRRLWLRHRSRIAAPIRLGLLARSGNKDREPMDRGNPRPLECLRHARRTRGSYPHRHRGVAARISKSGAVRQHDDPLQRPA
jgi:hypothetical protein